MRFVFLHSNFPAQYIHLASYYRPLPKKDYVKVLQVSSVHVYLTHPFVLSWSMLEAMAAGCLVVASDIPPVTEVLTDGVNGLYVDFFSPPDVAARVINALRNPRQYRELRLKVTQTILEPIHLRNCCRCI